MQCCVLFVLVGPCFIVLNTCIHGRSKMMGIWSMVSVLAYHLYFYVRHGAMASIG
jgi:hypothetical protein